MKQRGQFILGNELILDIGLDFASSSPLHIFLLTVLRHPQSTFFLLDERLCFTPMKGNTE
jgi:hypothetical protein